MLPVNRFIKIIVLILAGASLSFTRISYAEPPINNAANSITMSCRALYPCKFRVYSIYRSAAQNPSAAQEPPYWESGSFSYGKSVTYKVPPGKICTGVYPTHPIYTDAVFATFYPDKPGNYKGKMWGTAVEPYACLTLNGVGCL
ncbi:MAG: hypothetical protein KZQ65_11895 [Candidatus Thiodiazotropha sp. (ex Gloverina cf. vestifex)]|nr:hypothetical protein [Candidatus Thiodiazotropha sp. (ex Gloverina cf. vestifex)]